jgi:hypothetical protein
MPSSNDLVVEFTRPNDAGAVQLECDMDTFEWDATRSTSTKKTFCASRTSVGNAAISFSGSGLYSGDNDAIHEIMSELRRYSGAALPIAYGPVGNAPGALRIYGNGWITNYKISHNADEDIVVSFEGVLDGDDAEDTWPAS